MSIQIRAADSGEAGHVLIRDASWRLYRSFLREVEDSGGNTRLTFNNGKLEIMSPLPEHESGKSMIGRMVETMTFDRRIPIATYGSTTYASEVMSKGLEPDECYYIQNEAAVRGRKRFDLAVDPPPDLAIEIDISYRAIDREEIYAALGVPELWRYGGTKIDCLVLNAAKKYDRVERGRAFPFLPVGELARFIPMAADVGENDMLLAFLDWQRTLA